jgi:hypothetical protein
MELAVVEIARRQGDTVGSETRARIGLAALLVAMLFCFELVFATGDYAGPALMGAALAAALTIVLRRLGVGAFFTLLGSTVALIVYLCILFRAGKTMWGLPTPAALEGLKNAVSKAMEASVVDYAPVPVRSGYVILIVIGMWAVTTLGEVATFRWRTPLLASLGPIALVSITLVVGTGTGDIAYLAIFLIALFVYWSLESAHRLRSWGRWVGAFHKEGSEEPVSVTGSLARRMGAVCLAATLAAPVFLPALGDGLLDWRGDTGSGPGSGDGGEVDLLVDITPRLLEQSESRLFTVTTEEGAYWRLASLVDFDGEQWHALDEAHGDTDDRIPYEDSVPDGKQLLQTYDIDGLEGTNLPAAVNPVEVAGVAVSAGLESGSLELADGELGENSAYTVRSETPVVTYERLIRADVGDLGDMDGDTSYLITPELSPEVQQLREDWTEGENSAFQKLIAIQENLRQRFVYSTDIAEDADTSTDYLEQFLLDTRRGFCQQFATAFAVLARDAGYPTRVSVGFLPGSATTTDDGNFEYTVTGKDAHAWPEVYFRDIGWVAFEPTPRTDGLATEPSYTQPLPEGGGATGDLGTAGEEGGVTGPGNLRDLGRSISPRLDSRLRDPIEFRESAELPGVNEDAPWKNAFGRLVLIIGIAAFLWLVSVPAIKQFRISRRYRLASTPTETVGAAFSQFATDAAQLREPRDPSESPRAFADRLARADVVDPRLAKRLSALAERAEYSAPGSDEDQAHEAVRLARSVRRSMWVRASLVRRVAAIWSPNGLLPARRRRDFGKLLPAPLTGAN